MMAFFWLAVMILALMPLEAYEAESFMLAFLMVSGFLCVRLQNPNFVIPRGGLALIAGLFCVLVLLSVLFSEVMDISFIYACFFFLLPFGTLAVYNTLQQKLCITPFFYAALALVCMLSSVLFLHVWIWPQYLFFGALTWPFADPNALAGFCMLLLYGFVASALTLPHRPQRILAGFCILALLTIIMLTGSRATLLCMVLTLPVFVWLCWREVQKKYLLALAIPIAALILAFGPGLFTPPGETTAINRLEFKNAAAQEAVGSRFDIWQATLKIAEDHAWTGTGIGTFFLYYPAYRQEVNTTGLMAHADPLQFAAEMGFASPFLLYMFITAAVLRMRAAFQFSGLEPSRRIWMAACFCALGGLVLNAHATFLFYVLPVLLLAGALLAIWLQQTRVEHAEDITPGPITRGIITVCLLVMCLIFASLQGSHILLKRAEAKIAAGDMEGFAADVNHADRLSFGRNAKAFVLASSIPLGILEMQNGLDRPEAKRLFAQGWGHLDQAERLNPRLPVIAYHRARFILAAPQPLELCSVMNAKACDAEALLRHALALDPQFLSARVLLADVLLGRNQRRAALKILEDGLDWPYHRQEARPYYQKTAALAALEAQHDLAARALGILRAWGEFHP